SRHQVSSQGGMLPKWRGDGKELFYLGVNSDRLMAVDVRVSGSGITIGVPHKLFDVPVIRETSSPYDVSRDGQRFLLLERTISQATSLTVTNWRERPGLDGAP